MNLLKWMLSTFLFAIFIWLFFKVYAWVFGIFVGVTNGLSLLWIVVVWLVFASVLITTYAQLGTYLYKLILNIPGRYRFYTNIGTAVFILALCYGIFNCWHMRWWSVSNNETAINTMYTLQGIGMIPALFIYLKTDI